jgi:hypothetical protein
MRLAIPRNTSIVVWALAFAREDEVQHNIGRESAELGRRFREVTLVAQDLAYARGQPLGQSGQGDSAMEDRQFVPFGSQHS